MNLKIVRPSTKLYLLGFIIFLIFGCKNMNNQDAECDRGYYYLANDANGKINAEGKVLIHNQEEDSLYIEPEKLCSLHLFTDWDRKEFPYEVYNFPNLEFLWIAMRDFKELPKEITQLKNLKYIDLQNSGLNRLPENIGELKHLEELVLLFSDIEELPLSICQLSNLKTLHLGGTKIQQLPSCFKELDGLRSVILFHEDKELPSELKKQVESLKIEMPNCTFHMG